MRCIAYSDMAKVLASQYAEAPIAFGLQANGNVLQVYLSDANDTWTVVSTTPAGMSCILAAGKRFEILPVGDLM